MAETLEMRELKYRLPEKWNRVATVEAMVPERVLPDYERGVIAALRGMGLIFGLRHYARQGMNHIASYCKAHGLPFDPKVVRDGGADRVAEFLFACQWADATREESDAVRQPGGAYWMSKAA